MRGTLNSASESLHQHAFQAMNSMIDITFYSNNEDALIIEMLAKDWFRSVEERFSRFKPDSELAHLNRLAGERCMISDVMLEVLLLAEQYRVKTDGVFDPLILNALRQAGYDATYDEVKLRRGAFVYELPQLPSQRQQMRIDAIMKSVQLPNQTEMDLGGIVKSWAVQRFADYLQNRLQLKRGIINAGGDLTVWNNMPEEAVPWTVGIEKPWAVEEDIGQLIIVNGAAATSSKLGRHWTSTQGAMHHLIDPRIMSPSHNDVIQCTIAGGSVVACEVWAKVICIVGCAAGLTMLTDKTEAYEALIFTDKQETHFYGQKTSIDKRWSGVTIDHYHYMDRDAVPTIGGGRND